MINLRVIKNIFSNWAGLLVSIGIAFIVSPIFVAKLGNELYGVWALIVSITSYFNVLDFGINTAVVRFTSQYLATKNEKKINEVINSAFAFFLVLSGVALILMFILALNFKQFFNVALLSQAYLFFVFILVGLDLSINICFSVFQGGLQGAQKFFEINLVTIASSIVKNILLVFLLYEGYSLLALACVQLFMTLLKYFSLFIMLKRVFGFFELKKSYVNRGSIKKLLNYSVYSFIIAIAGKVIFFSDSVVIGSNLGTADVTLYAIPGMITVYLEEIVWAIVGVMVPIISGNDSLGDRNVNRDIYIFGSKYVLAIIAPIFFVLVIAGRDFLGLWMGDEFRGKSGDVLFILMVGFYFYLSQLVAHGILKGISKHRFIAIIQVFEAIANLVISLMLVSTYGIFGVAVGTMIPMLINNIVVLPIYTCKILGVNWLAYMLKSIVTPMFVFTFILYAAMQIDINVGSYLELAAFSFFSLILFYVTSFFLLVDNRHKEMVLAFIFRKG